LASADSLETDDLNADVLDTGVDAGEGYRGATRYGTTWQEERRGGSLDQLLAQEEPEQATDEPWTDEDMPSDEDRTALPRSGRLVAPDEGSHSDTEGEAVGVCCIEPSEAILTGNLTAGTPSGCLLPAPTGSRCTGVGAVGGVSTANLPAKITCDPSMQQTRGAAVVARTAGRGRALGGRCDVGFLDLSGAGGTG
jgi:hypothetical protein